LTGLAEATGGPAFSACAGLITYSQISPLETAGGDGEADDGAGRGQFARFGRWLKENF
jgi:cell division protein FtsA